MAQFQVDIYGMADTCTRVNNMYNKVLDAKSTIESIAQGMVSQSGLLAYSCIQKMNGMTWKLKKLADDIQLLKTALDCVGLQAVSTDEVANGIFLNIPKSIITGEKIIGSYDITYEFLKDRCTWIDATAIGLTADVIGNAEGLVGIGDTIDEKIMRQSLTKLISDVLKDEHMIHDYLGKWDNALNSDEYNELMKYIKTALKTGTLISEAKIGDICRNSNGMNDGKRTGELLEEIFTQKEHIAFLGKISDEIDNTLGVWEGAVDLLEFSDDFFERILTDYTQDVAMLEAIRKALTDGGYDNDLVNSVIDEMLWDYQNRLASAVKEAMEKVLKYGIDEGIKIIGGRTLKTLLSVKDIASMISGLDDQTDALSMVYATASYSYALVEKRDQYAAIIQSGNYTPDDLEQYTLYQNLATAAKIQEYNAQIELYENAIKGVNGLFVSEGEKDDVNAWIQELRDEVSRLQNMT